MLPEGLDPQLIAKLLNGDTDGISSAQINELGRDPRGRRGRRRQADARDDQGRRGLAVRPDVGRAGHRQSDRVGELRCVVGLPDQPHYRHRLQQTRRRLQGGPDGTLYYTIPVEELPLLAPLRAPSQLLGLATGGLDPNSPLADALEPMLRILVNSAYTDVKRNPDGTWTRTLDEFGTPTLFGAETLTRAEQALIVGDLIAALGKGVGDEMSEALTDLRKAVTEQLDVDLPAEQSAAIDEALRAPGTAITSVSRDVGTSVSEVLSRSSSSCRSVPP